MTEPLTFDDLALIAAGHTAFQLLWAGVNAGVFETLAEQPGMTREELAPALGLEGQPTRILLSGLATLRLLRKEGDRFFNSDIVSEVLVRSSPHNMIDVLGWQAHIVYPGEVDFLESLRRNTNVGLRHFPGDEDNLYARLAHDPELEKIFQGSMTSLSNSANAILADKGDFSGVSHLVDCGGGRADNAITLAQANPNLTITVFDSPTVCELASENIAAAGMEERVRTHTGDLFVTDFPESIDGIIFCHMLTIWSPERNVALLKRAYEALPDGGQLFIFNMMANDDDVGPMACSLGSPYFLTIATGEGMLYSWKDYEGYLAEAGFRQTERHAMPREHGLLVGKK